MKEKGHDIEQLKQRAAQQAKEYEQLVREREELKQQQQE